MPEMVGLPEEKHQPEKEIPEKEEQLYEEESSEEEELLQLATGGYV